MTTTTALSKSICAGFLEGVAEICTNARVTVTLPTGEIVTEEGVSLGGSLGVIETKNLDYDEWREVYGDED